MSELDDAKIELMRQESAKQFLVSYADLFDTLITQEVLHAKSDPDPERKHASELLEDVDSVLLGFTEGTVSQITVAPRVANPQKDKIHFTIGQHAGVAIQYVGGFGTIVRANFYGGLRDASHHADLRDSDISLQRSHTQRTDNVISQPISMNVHVLGSQDALLLDTWIIQTPQQIYLDECIFEEKIDAHPRISSHEEHYKPMLKLLNTSMKYLISMVPNPYSPR